MAATRGGEAAAVAEGAVLQGARASHWDAWEQRVVRVDDVAGSGPDRQCSRRRRMPCHKKPRVLNAHRWTGLRRRAAL